MAWKSTILVIDDSSTMLKVISNMLVDHDYQPILANSMEEALGINIKRHVNIAIVDLVMPDMDGLQGIEALRERDPDIRIIAMSSGDASHDPYHLLRIARRIGADAVIQKPFTGEQLAEMLDNIESISGVGCLRVLVIDDSSTICQAISNMLDDDRYRITTAQSANEALERSDILGIDVILTDIFMPGDSGLDVIERVRGEWPDVRLIAMSAGHGDQMNSSDALQAARKLGAIATLQKPFDGDQLHALLDQVTMDLQPRQRSVTSDDATETSST